MPFASGKRENKKLTDITITYFGRVMDIKNEKMAILNQMAHKVIMLIR